jgi:hypothetical protein
MRRKAQRLSGHGASSRTVMSDSALLSANLTRTPASEEGAPVGGELTVVLEEEAARRAYSIPFSAVTRSIEAAAYRTGVSVATFASVVVMSKASVPR